MQVHSWGRFPKTDSKIVRPQSLAQVQELLAAHQQLEPSGLIARGCGRSYGDSALASTLVCTGLLDHFISFDEDKAEVKCAAGVSLSSLLEHFVPRGFFLPVVPGTRFVSLGGAIASDVHGKNHHIDGSFGAHVKELSLLLANGELISCSPTHNADLFHATCGGMGLTGIIVDATISLKPISSSCIEQRSFKAQNLSEIFALFDEYKDASYSVAWLDCLAKNEHLGRSILYIGEHAERGALDAIKRSKLPIPIDAPSFMLNRYTMGAFNKLYFHKPIKEGSKQIIGLQPFFFPLDSIESWNRLYGKNGFVQYQFLVPTDAAKDAIEKVLNTTRNAGKGSFLSVLKKFGPANKNWLSFPKPGYTIALDFKWEPSLEAVLRELDAIIIDHGGRLYLTKDARMSEQMFKAGYENWNKFVQLRQETGADKVFNSLQSRRLGL
ncbi:MAG: FAD-binding oxidoreductase [Pseudohongiellaceae bacterium]|nr:FAD-binding oxidoreductase [Pseudohongiellaceae bacterium]